MKTYSWKSSRFVGSLPAIALALALSVLVHADDVQPPDVKLVEYRVTLAQKNLPVTDLYTAPGFSYRKLPVSYVDATLKGPSDVVVEAGEPIRSFAVDPPTPGVSPVVKEQQLCFHVENAPAKLAIRINQNQWLFLFMNRPSSDLPDLKAPDVISLEHYNVDATGKHVETVALQKAIDEAAARGKPTTLFVPPGTYRTGSLWMKSNVILYLDEGATLLGDDNEDSYPLVHYEHQPQWAASADPQTYSALLWFNGVHDAALRGRGVVDGQGSLRRDHRRSQSTPANPIKRRATNIVRIVDSERVNVEDVVIRDSECWAFHLLRSRDLSLKNVKVLNEMIYAGWDVQNPKSRWNNTDGIDVDACARVTVEDAFAYSGDDSFVLKSTNSGPTPPPPCEDILFRRCIGVASTFACKFGTESVGLAIRRVTFEDFDVLPMDTSNSVGFLAHDTATIEQIVFRRARLMGQHTWLVVQVAGRVPEQKEFVKIRDLRFEDIEIPLSPHGVLKGWKDSDSISGVHFSNIKVDGKVVSTLADMGLQTSDAKEVTIDKLPVSTTDKK